MRRFEALILDLKNKYGKVAVLYGGKSAEREVSLRSGKAAIAALETQGIDVVGIDACGEHLINALLRYKIDRCLIMFHGGDGENGCVQALLHTLNIPFTGSAMLGCALAMDKLVAKKIWEAQGFITPKFKRLNADLDVAGLQFPLAVKAANQGSSVSITKVTHASMLQSAFELATEFGEVMAEEWIVGKELTVPIVGEKALPSLWIEPANEFYDYDAKYITESTTYHCPSGVDQKTESHIRKIALDAYAAIHCSGWGRVDFILSEDNELYLIEANTVPGMTNLSLVPQSAKYFGWDFDILVMKILETTL